MLENFNDTENATYNDILPLPASLVNTVNTSISILEGLFCSFIERGFSECVHIHNHTYRGLEIFKQYSKSSY